MFRSVAKIAFTTWLWKKYKGAIVGGALVLLSLFFISMIHQDYVNYIAQLRAAGDKSVGYLGVSFFVKWGLIFSILIGYGLWFKRTILTSDKNHSASDISEDGTENLVNDELKSNKRGRSFTANKMGNTNKPSSDPFDEIRSKSALKSKADVIIEKHKK